MPISQNAGQFAADTPALRQVSRVEAYLVTARTLPGTEELRRRHAAAYTLYLEQHIDRIALGAQVLDAPGGPAASRFYLIRAQDAQTARALIEDSPYQQAGVYEVVDVKPAIGMLGDLMGGVAWPPRSQAAAR
jgi:uncharacterized protein YciI